MNATQRTLLPRRIRTSLTFHFRMSARTHILGPERFSIRDDPNRAVWQARLLGAESSVTWKARSGPGRRRVHRPTKSIPGPSPNPNDLSRMRSPPRRTSVAEDWGETRPLSPQTPLYPLSVPIGTPTDLVAERRITTGDNGAAACAKTGRQKGATKPKPAKPDPRLQTLIKSVRRSNSHVLRAFSSTP